jgi:hypothetical protein
MKIPSNRQKCQLNDDRNFVKHQGHRQQVFVRADNVQISLKRNIGATLMITAFTLGQLVHVLEGM